jgi:hypothetical protein
MFIDPRITENPVLLRTSLEQCPSGDIISVELNDGVYIILCESEPASHVVASSYIMGVIVCWCTSDIEVAIRFTQKDIQVGHVH